MGPKGNCKRRFVYRPSYGGIHTDVAHRNLHFQWRRESDAIEDKRKTPSWGCSTAERYTQIHCHCPTSVIDNTGSFACHGQRRTPRSWSSIFFLRSPLYVNYSIQAKSLIKMELWRDLRLVPINAQASTNRRAFPDGRQTLPYRIVSGLPVFIGSWVSPPIKAWVSKQIGPLRAMTLCFGTFVLGSAGTLFL